MPALICIPIRFALADSYVCRAGWAAESAGQLFKSTNVQEVIALEKRLNHCVGDLDYPLGENHCFAIHH